MSFLLAIESSGKPLSIALFKGTQLVEEVYKEPDGRGHSETLLPLIDQLLSRNKLSLDQIQSYAISHGPGSYTSLRVGMATLMGLIANTQKPIISVSTLHAMALGANVATDYVACVLAGGRGRIYAAIYDKALNAIVPDYSARPDDFLKKILKHSSITLVGGAIHLFATKPNCPLIESLTPRAAQVGQLALSGNLAATPLNQIRLSYLQEPDFG